MIFDETKNSDVRNPRNAYAELLITDQKGIELKLKIWTPP